VRGGAGDLYGADALGGVIKVLTFSPTRPRLRAAVDGGSHSTGRGSLFGGTRLGGWTATAAGEVVNTAGVITLDRAVAGPVDVKADSDYRTGFFSVGTSRERWRASVRLSGYAEDRNNGTPVQVNTTDWRQLSAEAGGLVADGAWEAHLASGSQDYYQTFSAVAGDRRTERLTTFQTIPSDFVSVAGQWSRFFGRHSVLLGADTRHTESTIDEYRFTLVSGVNTQSGPFVSGGTERSSAVFGRFAYAAGERLSLAVGLRGDFWKSEPVQQTLPTQSVSFFSPRFGLSYRIGDDVVVQGAVYRAHRTPTLNELHRGFRVGIIQTNPNVLLEPETLTGFESGFLYTRNRLSLRATAFVNNLDGAVANVTLITTPTLITRIRENSDEIRARGLEIEGDWRPRPDVTINAQTTFTYSRYRGSIATPALEGNRVPQVPGVQFSAGATWSNRFVTAAGLVRGSGTQYDDDQNTPAFLLRKFAIVDLSLSRQVARSVQGFFSVENLFDEDYDTGRTPLRTVGYPRTFRAGVRLAFP
jgi:outer membrane receptor protein involved in Fe transport